MSLSPPTTQAKGLCLLSLDAGGPLAKSQLAILGELMRRLNNDAKGDTKTLPCSVFDVIGGVGSGGFIAILLVIFGLSAHQTEDAFTKLSTEVLEIEGVDAHARTILLKTHITGLLKKYGIDKGMRLLDPNKRSGGCKLIVPLSRKCHTPSTCMLLNFEVRQEQTLDMTVAEALVATLATPPLFSYTSLFKDAATFEYAGGDLAVVNPIREIIAETPGAFEAEVACILSLGCGHTGVIAAPDNASSSSWNSFYERRVKDSETPAQVAAVQMGHLDLYQRFSIKEGLELSYSNSKTILDGVAAHTAMYLMDESFSEQAEACVDLLRTRNGTATLEQLNRFGGEKVLPQPLPPLTDTFVMRKKPWAFIEKAIFGARTSREIDSSRMLLVTGIGGCGKTQIIRKFIHEYSKRFTSVFVIDGSSASRIRADVVHNVRALGPAFSQMSFRACMLFLAQPATTKLPRLIVYDNVDDPGLQLLPLLPGGNGCVIVVTSRNRQIGQLCPSSHLELDVMSIEEAEELLCHPPSSPTSCTREEARELSRELGCLPIALTHARSYMFRAKCSASAYMERLTSDRNQLLARPVNYKPDMRHASTWAAFDASLELLTPSNRRILWLLSYMHWGKFPLELIILAARYNFTEYEQIYIEHGDEYHTGKAVLKEIFHCDGKWDLLELDDMMASLENSSIVSRTHGFKTILLEIHPLVHAWLQSRIPEEDRLRYKLASVLLLALGARTEHTPSARYLASHVKHMTPCWDQLDVNDAAAFGHILNGAGLFKDALRLRERVAVEVGIRSPLHDTSFADALWLLAGTCRKLGRFNDAELYQEEVLRLIGDTRGKCDPETVRAASDLATTYCELGRPHHADALQAKVRRHLMDALGEHHPDTITASHNLANILRQLGKLDDAEKLQVETLRLMKIVLGEEHPDTIKASSNLATTYIDLGRPAEAEILQLEAIRLMKKTMGECHPDTISTSNNLAATYFALEKYPKAREIQVQVLSSRKQVLGEHHPDTAKAAENLALTCRTLERLVRSRALQEEMLRILGERSPHANAVMINLAEVHRKLGNEPRCLDLLRKAMAFISQTLGVNHPEYRRCNQLLSRNQVTRRTSQDTSSRHQVEAVRTPSSVSPYQPMRYTCNGVSSVLGIRNGSHLCPQKRSREDEREEDRFNQNQRKRRE